jgi:hypothetical protein
MFSPWTPWLAHFDAFARRRRPAVPGPPPGLDPAQRETLARSLAVFQLGESGEGRIAREIDRCHLPGVDDTYRGALRLFVAEEGRHGRILADMVRALDGTLLRRTWTDALFTRARRLMGVRLKLVVLLAAEVVGITFYGLLAERLESSRFRAALDQICADETHHLAFHGEFFGMQAPDALSRAVFRAVWWGVAVSAVATVALDHRATLRAFGIPARVLAQRALARIREADAIVLGAGRVEAPPAPRRAA